MNQVESIMNFGYSKKGAELIIKKLNYYRINVNTFILEYDFFKKKLEDYDYDVRTINNILIIDPRLVTYSDRFDERYENFRKYLPGNSNDYIIISVALIYTKKGFNNKVKILKSFGFTDDDIRKILLRDCKIFTRSKQKISEVLDKLSKTDLKKRNIIDLLIRHSKEIFTNENLINDNIKRIKGYGFKEDEITKIVNNIPILLTDSNIDLEGLFTLFRGFGLKDWEIRENIVKYTKIVKYNKEGYQNIVDCLLKKGFTKEEIEYITLRAKEIVIYEKNKVFDFYKTFYEYDFTDDDIKKVFMGNPKLLYHLVERIKDTLDKLIEYDITKENLINLAVNYPNIFETSIETLDEKLRVIRNFDLMGTIFHNSKNLIQSAEKTYLRYEYMINELDIEPENLNEECALFRHTPSFKREDPETGKVKKIIIPDIDVIKSKGYVYYADNEPLEGKFKGRKCLH